MKIFIRTIGFIAILVIICLNAKVVNSQPIMTVFHFLNGKASLTLNETPFKKLLDKATLRSKNHSNVSIELQNTEIKIIPNPVISQAKVTFELYKNSQVKIFAYDNNSQKKDCFDGFLNQGSHDIMINLTDFNRGLVIFYFEIEGKVFTFNSIKI
jgi:hypothetical protein